jgi:hypothetical protein
MLTGVKTTTLKTWKKQRKKDYKVKSSFYLILIVILSCPAYVKTTACATSVSEHQLKAAGSSARTTTLACASCQTFLQGALHYLNILHVHTALWLKYGPICTLIPCLVRINFGTNCLDCFIDVWLVMFAARPDLCWIITATFDLIVGLKNKGGNSWDRCAPLRCILECKKIY